jgi:hypothetical protein
MWPGEQEEMADISNTQLKLTMPCRGPQVQGLQGGELKHF